MFTYNSTDIKSENSISDEISNPANTVYLLVFVLFSLTKFTFINFDFLLLIVVYYHLK